MRFSTVVLCVTAVLLASGIAMGVIGWADSQTVLGIVGAISALAFFLMQSALETARFKRELFVAFNETYSKLNDKLDDALKQASTGDLRDSDKKHLQDYFNLCGEEYFYYRQGYVDRDVWRTWLIGMNWWYDAHPDIARYWEEELKKGSYYRMDMSTLRKAR